MISTATVYTKAEYDKICEFAGSHFEYDDGLIVWKHNGQIIEDEILSKLLNQEDIQIYSQMATLKHSLIINNIYQKLYDNLDKNSLRVFANTIHVSIIVQGREKIRANRKSRSYKSYYYFRSSFSKFSADRLYR